MHLIITGAAGMLGQRLATALLKRGYLTHSDNQKTEITKLTLFDQVAATMPADPRLNIVVGDVTDPETIRQLITPDTAVVYHLAAIVSGEAEQDFDLGMQVNLAATQILLAACRRLETAPRFIFSSSIAVFGGELPPVIEDGTALTPQSSYGTQKAIGELLVNDYSRKGFIDGRVLRLPTIVVRPGKPNKATSTFASSIIREPLQGLPANCPVTPETRLWIMSPRQAIKSFIQAAEIPAAAWGEHRSVALPGVSVSVQEMLTALAEIAGPDVLEYITWQADPMIQRIVASWPADFAPYRAMQLGFTADHSIQDIIRTFMEDEFTER